MTTNQHIFEPMTIHQEDLINTLISDSAVNIDELLKSNSLLAGIPFMAFLSKQEASFIIDILKEKVSPDSRPWSPKRADQFENASDRPTSGQINAIRESVRLLDWTPDHFFSWLEKTLKIDSFRDLDRQKAVDSRARISKESHGRLPLYERGRDKCNEISPVL